VSLLVSVPVAGREYGLQEENGVFSVYTAQTDALETTTVSLVGCAQVIVVLMLACSDMNAPIEGVMFWSCKLPQRAFDNLDCALGQAVAAGDVSCCKSLVR
jgi:hypothetical protein